MPSMSGVLGRAESDLAIAIAGLVALDELNPIAGAFEREPSSESARRVGPRGRSGGGILTGSHEDDGGGLEHERALGGGEVLALAPIGRPLEGELRLAHVMAFGVDQERIPDVITIRERDRCRGGCGLTRLGRR